MSLTISIPLSMLPLYQPPEWREVWRSEGGHSVTRGPYVVLTRGGDVPPR